MPQILYNTRLREHEFTRYLFQHCSQVELIPHSTSCFDYGCGASLVLVHDLLSLESTGCRVPLCTRVEEALQLSGSRGPVSLLVVVNVQEPSLEVLSWLNLDCGVARRCQVVLCWSVEEAAQFLQSLVTASSGAVAFSRQGRADAQNAAHGGTEACEDESPFVVVREALTQTPQFLTESDVVRVVNRHKTVADLLLHFSAEAVKDLPGVSTKKAKRLEGVLQTPFHTALPAVADFLPDKAGKFAPRGNYAATDRSSGTPPDISVALSAQETGHKSGFVEKTTASDAMKEALRRAQMRDDADEDSD